MGVVTCLPLVMYCSVFAKKYPLANTIALYIIHESNQHDAIVLGFLNKPQMLCNRSIYLDFGVPWCICCQKCPGKRSFKPRSMVCGGGSALLRPSNHKLLQKALGMSILLCLLHGVFCGLFDVMLQEPLTKCTCKHQLEKALVQGTLQKAYANPTQVSSHWGNEHPWAA